MGGLGVVLGWSWGALGGVLGGSWAVLWRSWSDMLSSPIFDRFLDRFWSPKGRHAHGHAHTQVHDLHALRAARVRIFLVFPRPPPMCMCIQTRVHVHTRVHVQTVHVQTRLHVHTPCARECVPPQGGQTKVFRMGRRQRRGPSNGIDRRLYRRRSIYRSIYLIEFILS